MSNEVEKMGVVEELEQPIEGETQSEEKSVIVSPNLGDFIEVFGPIAEGWFKNQQQQRDHQFKMAQEQNAYNEKVLDTHKAVFAWQFWTVSAFLGAILLSGLYMLVFVEGMSEQGLLIVSHFAFGIFGVIAGFGIKSASNRQT